MSEGVYNQFRSWHKKWKNTVAGAYIGLIVEAINEMHFGSSSILMTIKACFCISMTPKYRKSASVCPDK